jgi:hypothetical protein
LAALRFPAETLAPETAAAARAAEETAALAED